LVGGLSIITAASPIKGARKATAYLEIFHPSKAYPKQEP
jgi:hypothetical protein